MGESRDWAVANLEDLCVGYDTEGAGLGISIGAFTVTLRLLLEEATGVETEPETGVVSLVIALRRDSLIS